MREGQCSVRATAAQCGVQSSRIPCSAPSQNDNRCIPFAFHLKAIPQKPGNSIVFDTPESTPAGYKTLISECRVTSQAGRRGFESRLPLHKINNLQASLKIVYLD
jgi:hypothetical protein